MRNWKTLVTAVAEEGRRLRTITLHQWVQTIVGAWCVLVCVLLLCGEGDYYDIAFQQTLSLPVMVLTLAVVIVLVRIACRLLPKVPVEGYILLFGAGAAALLLTIKAANFTKFYLYYTLAALLALLLFYAARQGLLTLPHLRPGRVSTAIIAGILLVGMGGVIGLLGTLRYWNYATPNYDFGIFAQMFHYMKETFQPLTTCERDELMSHFAVHISPIYYVLLPFYALFPSPVTLAIGQGVVIASGGIPLYLLSRKFGLSHKQTLLAVVAYTAYPALSCGTLYDLHENCFLAPLLLWMFYCYECRKTLPLILSVVLVLLVKEDAAVYVALFALYQAVAQRRLGRNAVMFLSAAIYFLLAVLLINQFGDGVLSDRYASLQYGDSGLLGMVKTLIVNPGIFLQTVLSPANSNASKLRYFAQLAVPLGLAVFTTRRPSRFLLLLPTLLNLLSSSIYQYDLTFQYSFGISAFLFYLCLLNLRDMPPVRRRELVSYMAASGVLLYILVFVPSLRTQITRYAENHETYSQLTEALATIPDDASVTCSTFLLPHLAQRDVVYEDYYHEGEYTDYLVLDLRSGYNGNKQEMMTKYAGAGYELELQIDDLVMILRRG